LTDTFTAGLSRPTKNSPKVSSQLH